jgi:MATE family multidrug resistance protein
MYGLTLGLVRRLKRSVAPGLRSIQSIVGGRSVRPDAGVRQAHLEAARTRREVIDLAWPIATAMLGDTAMGLVDTQLVGRLGAHALGGVGIGTMLMWLGYAFVFGLMRGVKVRVAHAVGEGRGRDAVAFARAGAMLGFAIGLVVWVLGRDASWALARLGIEPGLREPARQFLAARTFGAPAVFVFSALVQSRQGVGDSRSPMLVGLFGNIVNAVLAWSLIYGHLGLPALGVRGAGYATAATELLEASAMMAVVVSEARRGERPLISLRNAFGEVLQLGGPTGLHFLLETTAFTAFTAVLGNVGATEVAAHQIAMAVIRVSFLPGVAVAEASSVLVGRALGQRRLREADRVLGASLQLAVGFMTACGVAFAFGGGLVARGFTNEATVARVVVRLLHVAAVFQTLDAVTIVLRGSLRGAKDVRAVMLIGTTIVWSCVPTAAYVLGARFGMGAVGGWIGFVGETTLSAIVFGFRWKRGAWRDAYVGLRTVRHSARRRAMVAQESAA